MMRLASILFLLAWLQLLPSLALTREADIQLNGDLLSLNVNNQPLSSILEVLARQGVQIHIDPRIDVKISAHFKDRPVDMAMKRILKSLDYTLIWEKNSSHQSDTLRLSEMRIFYSGQEQQIRPVTSNDNLSVIQNSDGTYMVKGRLLLQLDPSVTEAQLSSMLSALNATVINKHTPSGILQLSLPADSDVEEIAATIKNYPGVTFAAPDFAYLQQGSSPSTLQPSTTLQQPTWENPLADSATIAIMDSGLLPGYEKSPFIKGVYDAVSASYTVSDNLGHGTQMTLIAAGAVAPEGVETSGQNSPVLAIRGIDDNGFTSNYTILRAIDYALAHKAQVLSMSWGSETPNQLLESATNYATENGLFLIAAAGNSPTGTPVYPAAYENVIGVGALTADGELWEQSNYGDFVSVNASGVADLPVGYQGQPGMYAGTSIATAYTARLVATIIGQNPEADKDRVLQLLSSAQGTDLKTTIDQQPSEQR